MAYKNKKNKDEWCRTHKEEIRVYAKKYYLTHKKEYRERRLAYNKKNAVRNKEYNFKYKMSHKKEISEYMSKYNSAHKEKIAKYYQINKKEILKKRRKYMQQYHRTHRAGARQNSALYKIFKTSGVPILVKKVFAIKRALKKNKLDARILNHISEGRTHEAYI